MRAVITGGNGFLGRGLADLLQDDAEIDEVVLLDQVPPSDDLDDGLRFVQNDVMADGIPIELLADGPVTIFHLASVVSAAAEADWQLAIDVNIRGLLRVLESAIASGHCHRLTFASSVAVFGGPLVASPVSDSTKQTPASTYGMTKAIGELLINDASRKGLIDGRTARLPTVVVRPGKPNLAASSFASGLFREPLQGLESIVPVAGDTGLVLIGAATAIAALAAVANLDADALGSERAIGLPGLTVKVDDMIATLAEVGGPEAVALLRHEPNPDIAAVVASWPAQWDDTRARTLNLPADASLREVVKEHVAL